MELHIVERRRSLEVSQHPERSGKCIRSWTGERQSDGVRSISWFDGERGTQRDRNSMAASCSSKAFDSQMLRQFEPKVIRTRIADHPRPGQTLQCASMPVRGIDPFGRDKARGDPTIQPLNIHRERKSGCSPSTGANGSHGSR
jgi:hypothetical protein